MRAASSSSHGSLSEACFSTQIAYGEASVTIASTSDQRLLSSPYVPIALYIGTARNAAGMKYVKSAAFITMRPPLTFNRLMANAAQVATASVSTPTATAIQSEFQICSQK